MPLAAGPAPDATCSLWVFCAGTLQPKVLFTAQKVHRLQEARLLLLGNVRYHNAWLLAVPTPTPIAC